MAFSAVRRNETVQAQRVTAKDGETVSTSNGPVHAPKGSHIVRSRRSRDEDWNVEVVDADTYKANFTTPRKRSAKKAAPAKKAAAKR